MARQTRKPVQSESILTLVEQTLEDDKATETVTIDLSGKTSIADYMVIASGQSNRQVGAMTDHILERLKKAGLREIAVEGQTHCDWVLIDAGDVVVHLFRPEVRSFYNLEKLWGDALPESIDRSPAAASG